jgi:hypothetical protein
MFLGSRTGALAVAYRNIQISDDYASSIAGTLSMIMTRAYTKQDTSSYCSFVTRPDSLNIIKWNHAVPFEQAQYVHILFETTARDCPNAEATYFWDGKLSYSELDRLASIGAQVLLNAGVK